MEDLMQITIDLCAYLLAPFSVILGVSFLVSLFRYK